MYTPCHWGKHHWVIRNRERPVTILQYSGYYFYRIWFIKAVQKSLPQEVNCNHFYYLCHISYISYISHIRKSVAAMKETVWCNKKNILDWEFWDLSHDPTLSINQLHIWFQVGLPVRIHYLSVLLNWEFLRVRGLIYFILVSWLPAHYLLHCRHLLNVLHREVDRWMNKITFSSGFKFLICKIRSATEDCLDNQMR